MSLLVVSVLSVVMPGSISHGADGPFDTIQRPPLPIAAHAYPDFADSLEQGLGEFQRKAGPPVIAVRGITADKYWPFIAPSIYYFLREQKSYFAGLPNEERFNLMVQLFDSIIETRRQAGSKVVIGRGRSMIALLDPNLPTMGPRQVETLAAFYGAKPPIFPKNAEDFLQAVEDVVASAEPATIVVLGHGTTDEIPCHICHADFANRLLRGARARPGDNKLDFSNLVFIFDCCFSADFVIQLANDLETQAQNQGVALESLPVMISSVNRGQLGHAKDIAGQVFVPNFWKAVNLRFYEYPKVHGRFYADPKLGPTKPGEEVALRHFFEGIDNYMYDYGRTRVIKPGQVDRWKVVNPDLIQDPVFFVPLQKREVEELRRVLKLPPETRLPSFLEIGGSEHRLQRPEGWESIWKADRKRLAS